jgi:hypothetical protein
MKQDQVYVSITGLRVTSLRTLVPFWWHAIRSMAQAQRAPGNLKAQARIVQGVHHTLTVWVDQHAMRAFLVSGAHRQAMRAFRSIGTGRVLGFETNQPPDWDTCLRLWRSDARDV